MVFTTCLQHCKYIMITIVLHDAVHDEPLGLAAELKEELNSTACTVAGKSSTTAVYCVVKALPLMVIQSFRVVSLGFSSFLFFIILATIGFSSHFLQSCDAT